MCGAFYFAVWYGKILVPFDGTFENKRGMIPVLVQKNGDQFDSSDLSQSGKTERNNVWKPLGSIATPIVAQRIIKISTRFRRENSAKSVANLGAAVMTNSDFQVKELSAINVGVLNEDGRLEATITLEEFLRVARSQSVFFHTNAPPGEIKFDLTIKHRQHHWQS
jgi:hypothetical protein